eukprot:GFUD01002323.1.p1 GENE.GFUD01002323.1~~GFUD01002323.1.p1  ORF type:complete len:676 (-),score=217.81 GFUD01002323.1:157-2109(-)
MVQADIRSRYASTLVTSEVENTEEVAREVFFNVILPETAFISRFAMEIDGVYYIAEVKEKEEAWKKYKEAVEKGSAAGHVGVEARHSNRFRVSVNTGARSLVRFYLLYEELLGRRGGLYQYLVNINPHQKLSHFSLGVSITEQRNITHIAVPELRRQEVEQNAEGSLEGADIIMSPTNPGKVTVNYNPNVKKLQHQLKSGKHPLQFVLEYEVDRSQIGGEVQLLEGYFVHFIAPENLPPMPKHVVFVLDTSGSMRHRKMQQTIAAMVTILGEMRSKDYMTIISFATNITVWEIGESAIVNASADNVENAVRHVEQLEAAGETNINDALVKALTILTHVKQKGVLKGVQPMVFFLTDGHPTVGVTDTIEILDNVRNANKVIQTPIFSLAFGRKTDFQMLRHLSVQNYGFARKIYTASDASLQLEGLYKEVSSPILSDVSFDYLDSSIVTESLTDTAFHTFYQGGEMVVAGMVQASAAAEPLVQYSITAHQADGAYRVAGQGNEFVPPLVRETVDTYIDLLPNVNITADVNFMERLWAYLSVKSLLRKVERGELHSCQQPVRVERAAEDGAASWEPIMCNNLERALYLSLRYHFVTPLTSLVVVKPDSTENGDIKEADMFNRKIRMMGGGDRVRAEAVVILAGVLLIVVGNT